MSQPSPSNDSAAAAPQRDSRGRFSPETPANPFGRKVAALRQAIVDAVSEEDLREITAMMVTCAKLGSQSAAKLVYQYAVGKPMAAADPDRVDHDEWRQRMERPTADEIEVGVQQRPPLSIGITCSRIFDDKDRIEAAEAAQDAVAEDLRKMAEADRRAASTSASGCRRPSSHGRLVPPGAGSCQAPSSVDPPGPSPARVGTS